MMLRHGMERSIVGDKNLGGSAAVLSSRGSLGIAVLALRPGGEGEYI